MAASFDSDAVTSLAQRAGDPDWLIEGRLDALERFGSLPWPEMSLEQWKHTDIRSLDLESFDAAPPAHEPVAGLDDVPADIRALAIGQKGDRLGLAIQIDADVVHTRLAAPLAQQGVIFAPLGEGVSALGERARELLGRAGVSDHEAKLAALNHAFASGGALLYVPRGVVVEKPIQSVRWLSGAGIASFPRVVVIVEDGASVTYIDHYASAELAGDALNMAAVEIYAGQAAHVDYLMVQDLGQQVWHFSQVRALIERDATVRCFDAALGGRLARSVVESVLDGQGARAEMLGLYFGDHAQHMDVRTLQLHRGPHTSSEVYYKGALKGTSHAVYSGLVDIEKDAKQADAQQLDRNLLLSDGAGADPSPFLEIKTSEVTRATHGVSVGRPDAEVLFYLRSRGLSDADAERLYVTGFFQEIIDRVHVPEVRETLTAAVEDELALED